MADQLCNSGDEPCCGKGRGGGRGFGGGGGMGGGGFGWGRGRGIGRMLAQGDLRLIALALIAEQPRHGYDIIKVLEDRTAGLYVPSPGVVYPTLTYLEETGHVTSQPEGAKKLYVITDAGRSCLADRRDLVEAVFERLAAIGERAQRERSQWDVQGPALTPLIRAALVNLRDVAGARLAQNEDVEAKIVEVLARAAGELRKA